jgi:hypothetical protein
VGVGVDSGLLLARAAAAAGGGVVGINAALFVVLMLLPGAALRLATATTARRRASTSSSSGSVGWRGCLLMVMVGWEEALERQQLTLTFAWRAAYVLLCGQEPS